MISRPTRVLIALAGLGVLSLPAFAQGYGNYSGRGAGELRLHVGDFRPDGKSSYWDGIRHDFTNSDPSDFEAPNFGLDYLLPLNDRMSVMFSGNWYEGNTTNSYRDFLDNHNDRIRHDTRLDIASGTVGLVVHLAPINAPIQPYVGAGGGAYSYRLEEHGDFIDFSQASLPVFRDRLTTSDTAFGYYFLAGLEFPVSRRVSLFAEGKWTRVKADLKDDFDGLGRLDLGGREIAGGISFGL